MQQGTQSMNTRMKELRNFYPDANTDDWELIDAGIRVQAIKKEDGDAGIVHFGTEVISDQDKTLSALLGAHPVRPSRPTSFWRLCRIASVTCSKPTPATSG